MRVRFLRWSWAALLVAPLLLGSCVEEKVPVGESARAVKGGTRPTLPQRYIVSLQDGYTGDPGDFAQAQGLAPGFVYRRLLRGFVANLNDQQRQVLAAHPAVRRVETDTLNYAVATQTQPTTASTGTYRMDAHLNTDIAIDGDPSGPSDIDVAIIDTGIDIDHPDLNVRGGCWYYLNGLLVEDLSEGSWDDQQGHGTHVAGIVAAKDDSGGGIVGVVPGARLWAARVFQPINNQGVSAGAYSSAIIAGIEWVTNPANTGGNRVKVANMSIGGTNTIDDDALPCGQPDTSAYHTAICNAVAGGTTFVVAAGNEWDDARNYQPAKFPEVITVSALADRDGKPWRGDGRVVDCGNGQTSADDSLACFSNYGPRIDIMAPGLFIDSTYTWFEKITGKTYWRSGYESESGTSMASPFVAGAAALYLWLNPDLWLDPPTAPSAVKTFLTTGPWRETAPCGGFPGGVCTTDPILDGEGQEPLLYLGVVTEDFNTGYGDTPTEKPPKLQWVTGGSGAVSTVGAAGPDGSRAFRAEVGDPPSGSSLDYAIVSVCTQNPTDLYLKASFSLSFSELKDWDAVGISDTDGNWLYWWWIDGQGRIFDHYNLATISAGEYRDYEIVVDYSDDENPTATLTVSGDTGGSSTLPIDNWGHATPPAAHCLLLMVNGGDQVHSLDIDDVTLRGRP